MPDQAPQSPIDIDAASLDVEGLRLAFISVQDMVRGFEAELVELRATEPEELESFQNPDIRLRGVRGITLLKRGRNSYDVALAEPRNNLKIEQLLVINEEDDHLECQTWDGRDVNVMKPFDLQRQVYDGVETNFTTNIKYENLGVNRRRAFLNSDPTNEEFQIITRSYGSSPYIIAASVTVFRQEFALRLSAPTQMEYKWMDLNVAGRSWAVDPDEGT